MVTTKFFEYLHVEFSIAQKYRPIFRVDPTSIKPLRPKPPYILLGRPDTFEARDSYHFSTVGAEVEDFGIQKVRHPIDQFVYVGKHENVAVAVGLYFPIPKPLSMYSLMRNIWQYSRQWHKKNSENGEFERVGVTGKIKEMTDPGEALGFIVDLPMEAMMEIDIVDDKGRRVAGQKEELRNFVVTLRSNHVDPGWKFNSESVRWYIDDINLTTRRIEWGPPHPNYIGTTKDPVD